MSYFDDEAFLEMRAEAHEFMKNKEESALKRWLESIGFKGTVGYYFNLSDNVVEIYTTRPGVLIGKAGSGVEAFIQILNEEFRGDWGVRFKEIRGDFVSIDKGVR